MRRALGLAGSLTCVWLAGAAAASADDLRDAVRDALDRAVAYYSTRVASHGGYVYHYSPDLRHRWGEGVATADQIWVQPPGTPTVGTAYLRAYAATRDPRHLAAATAAAEALAAGQLQSGGWTNAIDFDPHGSLVAQYRHRPGRGPNNSTLDDGISQSALRFLMRVDAAHEFRHAAVHAAVDTGLRALLSAQYANGAFPQVWTGPVPNVATRRAAYPDDDWRTEGKVKNYWDMFTLNDDLAGHVVQTLRDAEDVYHDARYREALIRFGDFLLLAQMPEPQPAWAQQYDYEMRPIWARRFEPPAIAGRESMDVLESLLQISDATGDARYLQPFARALAYLEKSRLPDGRLARYYELRTNRPLYMQRSGRDYALTYDDANLPDHYGWKVDSRLDQIARDYQARRDGRPTASTRPTRAALEPAVRQVIRELDADGRWLSRYAGERLVGQPKFAVGEAYLSSAVFSRHVELLSDYLLAAP